MSLWVFLTILVVAVGALAVVVVTAIVNAIRNDPEEWW